jgi:hypothetical protein
MVWYGAPPTPWTAIVATRWWQLDLSPAKHAETESVPSDSQVPHIVGRCTSLSRCRGRAHSYGHDLTRELQLIGSNTDRAAVQLGVSLSCEWGAAAQDREMAQAFSSSTAGACPCETKSISEHSQVPFLSCIRARPRIPRAAIGMQPLQYSQVPNPSCIRGRPHIPRAAIGTSPLEHLQMAIQSGFRALD